MYSWLPSEEKLDPQQREFLRSDYAKLKNVWISGFPGSGKSVLIVYAIKKILADNSNAKILLIIFTHSLADQFRKGFNDLKLSVDVVTTPEFYNKRQENYDHIFCDEVQDLCQISVNTISERGKHIVVAGDEHQSIYEEEPYFKQPTIQSSSIPNLISGDKFSLIYIHRLSRSIISAVQKMMPEMNIFQAKRDLTKKDVQIRLCTATDTYREVEYVIKEAQRRVNKNYGAAILLPTRQKIIDFCNMALCINGKEKWDIVTDKFGNYNWKDLNNTLRKAEIPIEYVGSGYGLLASAETNKRIVIMTYHSAKGLDFENVFIPNSNDALFLYTRFQNPRTLFMVAMTRSKENLYISYSGKPLSFIETFANSASCTKIEINNIENNNEDFDSDIDF